MAGAVTEADLQAALAPPFAFGGPPASGVLRCTPDDFEVEEQLGFRPEGDGNHCWLRLRKRGANSEWLARQLAQIAGVDMSAVGYAGQKDRHAVTTQWFSIDLQGRHEPSWQRLLPTEATLLERSWGRRKLRRGELAGNRFRLVVREVDGDPAALANRLQSIETTGVPSYFGAQRFGHAGGNLVHALAMLRGERVADRHLRGLYLSAARSMLFNRVLALRVRQGNWRSLLAGEVVMIADTGALVPLDKPDDGLQQRCARQRLHPTGPLWGRGARMVKDEALALEQAALEDSAQWCALLEAVDLGQQRRSLRALVGELQWQLDAGARTLHLGFELAAGEYATAVMRELVCEQTTDRGRTFADAGAGGP